MAEDSSRTLTIHGAVRLAETGTARQLRRPPSAGRSASESGAILMAVVLAVPLIMLIHYGMHTRVKNHIDGLKIARLKERMRIVEMAVANAAQSLPAIVISGGQSPGPFAECIADKRCATSSTAQLYLLRTSVGTEISGQYGTNGRVCALNEPCPIRATTKYMVVCGNGAATCERPADVVTTYRIEIVPQHKLASLIRPLEGQVSLSAHVCPASEVVNGVDANGHLLCYDARREPDAATCPPDPANPSVQLVPYGLDRDKGLMCRAVDIPGCNNGPLALALIIDTSGSMKKAGKLDEAKRASDSFLGRLRSGDSAGLGDFDSVARLDLPLIKDIGKVRSTVHSLRTLKNTNITGGLKVADEILPDDTDGAAVILLSDGMHNTGPKPLPVADALKLKGVTIFTIAFGQDADRVTLRAIASSKGYSHVASEGGLQSVFDAIAKETCR